MIGRTNVAAFDQAILEASRSAQALSAEIAPLAQRMDAIRAEMTAAYRELANVRLSGAGAAAQLDAAADEVQRLIAERSRALAEAERALAEARTAVAAAQPRKTEADSRLDQAEQQAEAALAAARRRLATDAAFAAQRQAAELADRTATHAEQKASLAARDRDDKGAPYLADPLFAYLWNRGFGTPAYQGGGITRLMDGFVARVAAYEPARRNYAALTDLPAKLADHALHLRELAAAEAAKLDAMEEAAAVAAGGPDATTLERLRKDADAAEQAAEAADARLRDAAARHATMAAGQDEGARETVARIEAALQREDIAALREAAARTPSPHDDALVARIERLETERWRLAQAIEQRRALLVAAQQRAAQAEELRREYRQRGYGGGAAGDMGAGGQAMLGALLGQVLSGALNRDTFMDRMGGGRPPDPWRRGGGGPWGGGGGSGSGGGGGFKTGGGF
jgi:outer membrane murein-binding lipoprotein Lpp